MDSHVSQVKTSLSLRYYSELHLHRAASSRAVSAPSSSCAAARASSGGTRAPALPASTCTLAAAAAASPALRCRHLVDADLSPPPPRRLIASRARKPPWRMAAPIVRTVCSRQRATYARDKHHDTTYRPRSAASQPPWRRAARRSCTVSCRDRARHACHASKLAELHYCPPIRISGVTLVSCRAAALCALVHSKNEN